MLFDLVESGFYRKKGEVDKDKEYVSIAYQEREKKRWGCIKLRNKKKQASGGVQWSAEGERKEMGW